MLPLNLCCSFAVAITILLMPATANCQDSAEVQRAIELERLAGLRSLIEKDSKLLTSPLPQTRLQPLHFAIQNGKTDVVKLLLELNAPLDAKNNQKTTALHTALRRNQPKIIELILEKTKNVNTGDRNQSTPLMYVIMYRQSNADLVDRLLKKGADINAKNSSKQTALHVACYYGRADVGVKLIEAGADLDAVDNNSNTPLLAACQSTPKLVAPLLAKGSDPLVKNRQGQSALHLACQSNRLEVVEQIIDLFKDVDQVDKNQRTPLVGAVYSNNAKIVQLLLDRGADPNLPGSTQNPRQIDPILCHSAMTGNHQIIKTLIEGGAKVNVKNRQGDAPLHLAAQAGNRMIDERQNPEAFKNYLASIQTLMDHQADLNAKNKAGQSPIEVAAKRNFFQAVELLVDKTTDLSFDVGAGSMMHWAAKNGLRKTAGRLLKKDSQLVEKGDDQGRSPIQLAAESGHNNVVELLIENGANVDRADDEGLSALLVAAGAGHADVVGSLVKAGADTTKLDGSGQSALHLAAWNGAKDVVAVLLENMDQSQVKTQTGYTPLHGAAWNGHSAVVLQLLTAGADPNATDSDGWTPLHKAAYRGHADSVKALLQKGADKNRKNGVEMIALEMAEGNKKTEVVALLK